MPHYTEANEYINQKEKNVEVKPKGPNFNSSDLIWLNTQPSFDYLKINQKISTKEEIKVRSESEDVKKDN